MRGDIQPEQCCIFGLVCREGRLHSLSGQQKGGAALVPRVAQRRNVRPAARNVTIEAIDWGKEGVRNHKLIDVVGTRRSILNKKEGMWR